MGKYYKNTEFAYRKMNKGVLNSSLVSFLAEIHDRLSLKDKRILDLGCGTGELTHSMTDYSHDVAGIDVSEAAIAIAKSNHPMLEFSCEDIVHFQTERKLDFILDAHCLHCIVYDHERRGALQNIYASLAPGGYFAMETMVYHSRLAFSDDYYFEDNGILWKRSGDYEYWGKEMIKDCNFIPYRRIRRSIEIEEELKTVGFNIIYLRVSGRSKLIVDDRREDPLPGDPDTLRVICQKNDPVETP